MGGGWIGLGAGPNPDHVLFPADGVVRLFFDEPMTLNALFGAVGSYGVIPTGPGVPVAVVAVAPGPGANPEFVDLWTAPWMTDGEGYEVAVDPGLTDMAGNPMATLTLAFVAPAVAANQMDPLPLLEVLTGVFGEEMAELCGYRQTRLTAPTAVGDLNLLVESTLDWPATGTIAVGGVVYAYTGTTPGSFTGISHVRAGVSTPGAAAIHRDLEVVADLNRSWSGFDLLRRGLFVETAEGEDLTTIGRNLGVPRRRMFTTDAQFRDVVQALAYNPRGTLHGLRQALTALVGAGNFEIYEDLVKDPCVVVIRIDPTVLASTGSVGKTWLTDQEWAALNGASTQIVLTGSPDKVFAVRIADLDQLFDFRTALPSVGTYVPYPGGAPIVPFTYTGADPEGAAVIQVAGSHIRLVSAGGTVTYSMGYLQGARCFSLAGQQHQSAEVVLNVEVYVPTGHIWAGDEFQLAFQDGNKNFQIAISPSGPTDVWVSVGASAGVSIPKDEWHELEIRRPERGWLELWVDGTYCGRSLYTDVLFPIAGVGPTISFGLTVPSAGLEVWVRQVGAHTKLGMDFWALNGTGGCGIAATRFDDGLALMGAVDVGRKVVIMDSWATNPQGGNNNYRGVVASEVVPGSVLLEGEPHVDGATVDSAHPTWIQLGDKEALVYPDDLGKTLVISGSALGNDGAYVITGMLEEGTLTDLASYGTQYPTGVGYVPREARRTGIAVIAGAAFVSEPNLDWRLDPVFVAEPVVGMMTHLLTYVLGDASTEAAGTITFRNVVLTAGWPGLLMEAYVCRVLSAQLLFNHDVDNDPVGTYHPFYLSDLIGFLAAYLQALLAAGVIPKFEPMI
jgi:hypothetical protein